MTVNFKSNFVQNGNDFEVAFKAPLLQEDEFEGAKVIEFIDPERKIVNRFEFGEKEILIIAGPSSIQLVLDETVDNEYPVEGKFMPIVTFMKEYNKEENLFEFKYELLSTRGDEIGKFHITISIEE
ncbi:hypothetical protein CJJ23_02630 [Mycoplasmopsis agassizii]|uniref:Uncharacterized protein n=1 Tax=Mycoplasmopsis agassizii TaxID=33922 RepID=A0A269TIL2_9BACT|nr:hypothetical protein [Mycoplasmopsis agassizii]PAK21309.1 hypothetical protein CJJ23_02630 [Mycoplasmopsis agassizii]